MEHALIKSIRTSVNVYRDSMEPTAKTVSINKFNPMYDSENCHIEWNVNQYMNWNVKIEYINPFINNALSPSRMNLSLAYLATWNVFVNVIMFILSKSGLDFQIHICFDYYIFGSTIDEETYFVEMHNWYIKIVIVNTLPEKTEFLSLGNHFMHMLVYF
jgi:hypothetical protein